MYKKSVLFLFLFYFTNAYCISNHFIDIKLTDTSSGINGIDCIYVINLAERPQRWERVKSLCEPQHLHPNRVNAVNGWKLSSQSIKELTQFPHDLKKGAVGCLLSHLSILQHAFENQFECIWVMEDDIVILDDPHEITFLLNQLNEIDPEWDIFYTDIKNCWHINGKYCRQRIKEINYITDTLLRVENRYQTHSMIISKRGIEKILNYFLNKKFSKPIDVDIHFIPSIKKYSSSWNIVSSLFGLGSDTENSLIGTTENTNFTPKKIYNKSSSVQKLIFDSFEKHFPILNFDKK